MAMVKAKRRYDVSLTVSVVNRIKTYIPYWTFSTLVDELLWDWLEKAELDQSKQNEQKLLEQSQNEDKQEGQEDQEEEQQPEPEQLDQSEYDIQLNEKEEDEI